MSFWGDFAGGFLADQSRQMQQAEQLSIAEAIEERRRRRQIEDEERARVARKEDQVDLLNAQSEPTVGYGASGEAALLRRRFSLDNGRIQRTDEELGKPLMRPKGKPYEVKENGQIVTYQEYSDGLTSEQRQIATAPRMRPGGPGVPCDAEGLTPYQRRQLDEKKTQAERDAAKEAEAKAEAERAKAEARADKELDRLDRFMGKMKSSDWAADEMGFPPALDEIERQFGVDLGLNARTPGEVRERVREQLLSRAQPSAVSKSGKGGSRENPVDATEFEAEPPPGTWVRLPNGRVIQIPGG